MCKFINTSEVPFPIYQRYLRQSIPIDVSRINPFPVTFVAYSEPQLSCKWGATPVLNAVKNTMTD